MSKRIPIPLILETLGNFGFGLFAVRSNPAQAFGAAPPFILLGTAATLASIVFTSVTSMGVKRQELLAKTSYLELLRKHFLHCLSAQILALIIIFTFLKSMPIMSHLSPRVKLPTMAFEVMLLILMLQRMRLSLFKQLFAGLISITILATSTLPELIAYACLTPCFLVITWLSEKLSSFGLAIHVLSLLCLASSVVALILSVIQARLSGSELLVGMAIVTLGAYSTLVTRGLVHQKRRT